MLNTNAQFSPTALRDAIMHLNGLLAKKMDDILDMIVADESPSQISDKIKEVLYAKSADKINDFRPTVGNSMFDTEVQEEE